jgi:hypothetical protein
MGLRICTKPSLGIKMVRCVYNGQVSNFQKLTTLYICLKLRLKNLVIRNRHVPFNYQLGYMPIYLTKEKISKELGMQGTPMFNQTKNLAKKKKHQPTKIF